LEEFIVMKLIARLVPVFGVIVLSGCATAPTPLMGLIHTNVAYSANGVQLPNADAVKTGKACATSILGLLASGDASIAAAKKAGRIENVLFVDYQGSSLLGLYAEFCTVVRGTPKSGESATSKKSAKINTEEEPE